VLEGLPGFLRRFPDRRHDHLIPEVADRSVVLPVGVDLARLDPPVNGDGGPPIILWNHRWDADKDPGAFLSALSDLADAGLEFRVAFAGERLGRQAETWEPGIAALGDRVVVNGFLEPDDYRDVLRRSDIVVSTARQEFFGVAIVEAVYAGALPLLPDRLVYPEQIPPELHSSCLYRGGRGLRTGLRRALEHRDEVREVARALRSHVARFDWSAVAPRYDDWLESVVAPSYGASGDSGGGGAPVATES
jgi:glycosyltransferase involved in cell wall biosynthesis